MKSDSPGHLQSCAISDKRKWQYVLWLLFKHKRMWQTTASSSTYSSHFRHHSQTSLIHRLQETWLPSVSDRPNSALDPMWWVLRLTKSQHQSQSPPHKKIGSEVINFITSFGPLTRFVGWIPTVGAALSQVMRYGFPVQFTMSLNHAFSHNASLRRVLHDGLSTSSVPVSPCGPHLQ